MKKFLLPFLLLGSVFADSPPYITDVGCQQFTITIPANATSNTLTIATVGNLAFPTPGGYSSTLNSVPTISEGYAELTNPNTITAFRGGQDGTNTVIISGTIVDATPNLVRSVQRGTITIPVGANIQNQAITAVDTNNTVLIYQGRSVPNAAVSNNVQYTALTFDSTNVAAFTTLPVTTNINVRYTLLELQPAVLNQNVQHYTTTMLQAATLTNQDLTTPVSLDNSFTVWSGTTVASGLQTSLTPSNVRISNTTTNLDLRTAAISTGTNTIYTHVVDLKPGVLRTPVQRFSTSMSNTNFASLTISPVVNLNKALMLNTSWSISGGSYTTYQYYQIVSPSILTQTRNTSSANATLPRGQILEFFSDTTIGGLLLEQTP